MRDIRVATVQFQHAPGDKSYNLERVRHFVAEAARSGVDASLLPTSSGRRWLRARRPELYEGLTRRTGQEVETRQVRFGE